MRGTGVRAYDWKMFINHIRPASSSVGSLISTPELSLQVSSASMRHTLDSASRFCLAKVVRLQG